MADQSATPSVPGLQVPTHTSPLSAEDASATTSPARGAEMRNFLQTRLNKNRAPPLVHTWDFYHDRQDRTQSTNLSNLPTNGSGSEDRGDGETAYEARLEHLAVIDDVRKFWNVFNNFDITRLVLRDSVHLFHKGVKPVWEDPRNSKGGAWTFRVPKHAAPAFWQEVCMLAIGEQLQSAVYEEGRTTFKDDICGVSLGVRFNSMLVQIWNRDGEHTAGIEGMLEIWLRACENNFPRPPLWKTLREACLKWRHRLSLIEQWNRACLTITSRLLLIMYGPTFPDLKISDDDSQATLSAMSSEALAQTWYRLLRMIGNPADLCSPSLISQTPGFVKYAITSPTVVDPSQHPCLQMLPFIFFKAIKGIASQVDAFLGISQAYSWESMITSYCGTSNIGITNLVSEKLTKEQSQASPTPIQRRLAKSFSVAPSNVTKAMPKASLISITNRPASVQQVSSSSSSGPSSATNSLYMTSLSLEIRSPLAPERPKCNSVLHLFGEWLFKAAFINSKDRMQKLNQIGNTAKRPSSVFAESPSLLHDSLEATSILSIDHYESGRAEAIGTICRIFCSKKTEEEILPIYLARFYQAANYGLKFNRLSEIKICGETLAFILANSSDLFRLDLDGVQILIPAILSALETVLPHKEINPKFNMISEIELRRSSIHLLLSMLALPLHFQNLSIKEIANQDRFVTFSDLKSRLVNLMISALQVECDPQNSHMLLGGLLFSVQDSATIEEAVQVTQPDVFMSSELPPHGLHPSCVSDTTSQISISSEAQSLGEGSDIGMFQDENITSDSAHTLFVRAIYLVCHRLISSWKTDLNISLAALELLTGLAKTQIRENDLLECKRAVKWLCDYISYQCSRPPPAHSKDLHSSIVAAFSCLTAWLIAHPQLLQDKDCLATVLEVVELGISGSKSVGKPGEPIKMKDEKELHPASMRVRDAADVLLKTILEQVGYFPNVCGAQSLSSFLDEMSLLRHCDSWPGGEVTHQMAIERFRYFVTDNATMLAILEEPLGNDQDPQPTVTVLIRGPFGRHSWTMQLRHLPRHKSIIKSVNVNPGRPLPLIEPPRKVEHKPRFFPDNVDKIPHCKVDEAIPSLEAVINETDAMRSKNQSISKLLDTAIANESRLRTGSGNQIESDKVSECVSPKICHDFQTARLFLSHFGFLNLDPTYDKLIGGHKLTALDSTIPGFATDLEALDRMSGRTCDTAHIFYVQSGQTTAESILANIMEKKVSAHFTEFLTSLGWQISNSTHAGWSGHESTMDRRNGTENPYLLYWADVSSEIAFVIPTSYSSSCKVFEIPKEKYSDESDSPAGLKKSPSNSTPSPSSSLGEPSKPQKTTRNFLPPQTDTKIMVAWLESLEDSTNFPISDLLQYTETGLEHSTTLQASDVYVIFLQTLASGLLRVKLQGPTSRMNLATPLVDGMVVSRRVVGTMVQQTVLNIGRRKRLDNDSYHPPHVRRRLKVQEIVQKYKRELEPSELLTLLFDRK